MTACLAGGRCREWHHSGRSQEAFEAHFTALKATRPPGSIAKLTGYSRVDGPAAPDQTEAICPLWIDRGGRKRAEFSVGDDDVMVVVFDGPSWWSWTPRLRGRTNAGRPNFGHGSGASEVLIETAPLLAALRLEFLGDDVVAGRSGEYAVKFFFFTFDTLTNPSGSGEVRERITVDGDELHGTILVTLFAATGAVVLTDNGNPPHMELRQTTDG